MIIYYPYNSFSYTHLEVGKIITHIYLDIPIKVTKENQIRILYESYYKHYTHVLPGRDF